MKMAIAVCRRNIISEWWATGRSSAKLRTVAATQKNIEKNSAGWLCKRGCHAGTQGWGRNYMQTQHRGGGGLRRSGVCVSGASRCSPRGACSAAAAGAGGGRSASSGTPLCMHRWGTGAARSRPGARAVRSGGAGGPSAKCAGFVAAASLVWLVCGEGAGRWQVAEALPQLLLAPLQGSSRCRAGGAAGCSWQASSGRLRLATSRARGMCLLRHEAELTSAAGQPSATQTPPVLSQTLPQL